MRSWADMRVGAHVHTGFCEQEDPGPRKERSAEWPGTCHCYDFGGAGMKPGL